LPPKGAVNVGKNVDCSRRENEKLEGEEGLTMKLGYSFPKEVEAARAARVPLVIPAGTIEYHGPHCAFGCDTLVVEGLLERLSRTKPMVIAPSIWYGPASYAVAGPEKGSVNVDYDRFEGHVYDVLKAFVQGGWRNIYVVIHHQYEEENLLPMTLCFKKAAMKIVFEHLQETVGMGWWGDNKNRDFYANLSDADSPWNWFKVIPAMSRENQHATGYDHAGKYEASILAALYPETVDISRIAGDDSWFIQNARESSPELGNRMVELCLADLSLKIR
jgi:creatinine amidohydrolase/Fe(II)-dependent formamide hydrolase-like protein